METHFYASECIFAQKSSLEVESYERMLQVNVSSAIFNFEAKLKNIKVLEFAKHIAMKVLDGLT